MTYYVSSGTFNHTRSFTHIHANFDMSEKAKIIKSWYYPPTPTRCPNVDVLRAVWSTA